MNDYTYKQPASDDQESSEDSWGDEFDDNDNEDSSQNMKLGNIQVI